jgi:hypothetical protein
MKVSGLAEIHAAQARLIRLYALQRVERADLEYIASRLDEVEARIISMTEIGEDGEEVRDDAAESSRSR